MTTLTVARIGLLLAGLWFVLTALAGLFGLVVAGVLLWLIALIAGVCLVISALTS